MTIIGQQVPIHDALTIDCPRVDTPVEGFDTLTERLWVPYSPFFAKGTLRRGPRGIGDFYVADEQVVTHYAGRPVVELRSRGIAIDKPYKTALRESIVLDADTLLSSSWWKPDHARVSVWYVQPTKPVAGSFVGEPALPPETYGLPAVYWGRVNTALIGAGTDPDWRGYGWLGEDRIAETLPGCEVTLIQDIYLFDYLNLVGGGSRDDL